MTDFLDTNVLVYAYSAQDSRKQKIAAAHVTNAIAGAAIVSSQVLAEFSVTLLRKANPPVPHSTVLDILNALAPIRAFSPDALTVQRAVQASETYGLHLYDGMIIASAERARCPRILSEDLNHGQTYFGIRVENPFL